MIFFTWMKAFFQWISLFFQDNDKIKLRGHISIFSCKPWEQELISHRWRESEGSVNQFPDGPPVSSSTVEIWSQSFRFQCLSVFLTSVSQLLSNSLGSSVACTNIRHMIWSSRLKTITWRWFIVDNKTCICLEEFWERNICYEHQHMTSCDVSLLSQ